MTPLFADTSFYAACLIPRDSHHTKALALAASNRLTIVTTEFVFVELANLFSKLARRTAAVRLINQVRSDSDTLIAPATSELLARGFELFEKRIDKEWSLTDCISFVVMEEHGVSEALTSDSDFEQAGFRALLL
ncbi:MAG: type II toxin-antitoxin system VapC family toxin [Hyphomicrobiaceae bacterium]